MDSVQAQLENSRRELLDLGLRNSLINYRLSTARSLEIVDELPAEIYRILVKEKKAMSFLGLTDPAKTSPVYSSRFVSNQLQPAPIECSASAMSLMEKRHTDNKLQTREAQIQLPKKLLKIFYDSNTSLEEQGVNLLFLALGMLVWYEPENKYRPHRAPLLLLPVRLERSESREHFQIRYTEQELGDNLSLKTKLRNDFGIYLPSLDEDNETDIVNLEAYFERVEKALKNQQPDWYVDPYAIALDFFSFGKFLMYQDLDEVNWHATAKPYQHPILRWLFNAAPATHFSPSSYSDGSSSSAASPTVSEPSPTQLYPVLDVDGSQLQAIADVHLGKNLVIQGPPGTGKSQTITNLIAQAIADGKTVLFVTEKMAALEVVKHRLDNIGLGAPCLELHSHKATKKAVLAELGRTMTLEKPSVDQNDITDVNLNSLAAQLDQYAFELNEPIAPTTLTPYGAIGELLQITRTYVNTVLPRFKLASMEKWNDEAYQERLELVKELVATLEKIGRPAEHPFNGSNRLEILPNELNGLNAQLQSGLTTLINLKNAAAFLAESLALPVPNASTEVNQLSLFYRRILDEAEAFGHLQLDWASPGWLDQTSDLVKLAQSVADYKALHTQYDSQMKPEGWQADLVSVRNILVENGENPFHWLLGSYREARTKLDSYLTQNAPGDLPSQLALIEAVVKHQEYLAFWQSQDGLGRYFFRSLWQGIYSDETQLFGLLERLQQLHQAVRSGTLPPRSLHLLTATAAGQWSVYKLALADLQKALQDYETGLDAITAFLQLKPGSSSASSMILPAQSFAQQQATLEKWSRNGATLYNQVRLNVLGVRCGAEGLDEVYDQAVEWPGAIEHLIVALRKSYVEALLESAYRSRPGLHTFWRDTHERAISRFYELDALNLINQRSKLALLHWQRMPQLAETKSSSGRGTVQSPQATRLALIKREIGKKSRHLPIRELFVQTAPLIQQIKPVFMMSPLSIAAFLKPGAITFDLVIFDEASQIKPVDALGAILRGRQVVVAGDDQQLPPTSFFEKLTATDGSNSATSNDDEAEEANFTAESKDFESILTLFKVKGEVCMLRWHYRSRHDSLIEFSNRWFYDNKLITFPSPDYGRCKSGLIYHHMPNTVYDRSQTRTNSQEAQAVAQAVMSHARQHPHLSLGVATFSSAQRLAIEEQVEQCRLLDRSGEGFFRRHPTEPFFIKNLENVQGDERDVILISVGYGRDSEGKISLNFGPLSTSGGERRLNVLITRAKQRCEVFTNLLPADIDLNRAKSAGMRALREYLETAHAGSTATATQTNQPKLQSPLEQTLFAALVARGYEIHQPSHSIALAVTDPNQEGQYLIGLDTDGSDYADIARASDRERLRSQILTGLGWKLHRVWSVELYRDLNQELDLAVAAIERALHQQEPSESANSQLSADLTKAPTRAATRADIVPILHDLIKEYGPTLADNSKLVRNLLADLCPPQTQPWQRNILVMMVEEGYLRELLARRDQPLNPWIISNWSSQLENSRGIRSDLVKWGVECWVEAMQA